MSRKALINLLIVAAVVATAVVLLLPTFLKPTTYASATIIDDTSPLPRYALTDYEGNPFTFGQSGQYQLVFFGYTNCPDVCPLTLARLNRALELMGNKANEVQVVFVSVDPDRDTLDKLKAHTLLFNPLFLGVTGSKTQIDLAAKDFGVYYEKVDSESASGYLVNHSSHVTVVDPSGKIRAIFPFEAQPQAIADDMKKMVN
ncbi:MAG: SCO family protein [Anaerolineales bacterium]|nr:SCO family protein [Anaerolineales bacterium]MCB9126578.1 SCO family protein [Ardenticatenales bacterium]MCB9172496.1 SCO family protein [Ardenticatenales bacterium]